MTRIIVIFVSACLMGFAIPAFGQTEDGNSGMIVLGHELTPKDSTNQKRFTNRLIAPKGEWQCGLSVMYTDFNSADSDYMLLLQGLNARASLVRLSPQAAYTFRENHAVGVRFNYTKASGMLDSATADLLGNISLSVGGISAVSTSMGGSIFQRTYVGIDEMGRFGITWDYILGYTKSKTQFSSEDASDAYTVKQKVNLAFAPGIVYFPMNNVSIQACISIADLSYAVTTAYEHGTSVGKSMGWNANATLNLLNLSLGLTVHF